jgi:hypothetical protein
VGTTRDRPEVEEATGVADALDGRCGAGWSMMRPLMARAATAGNLLVAAAVATLAATVVLTAFLLYANLLPDAGYRRAVADAPVPERTVLLTSAAGKTERDRLALDRAARDLFSGGLAGVPLRVYAGGETAAQRLPDELPGVDPGEHGAYAVVGFLTDVRAHAQLTDGAWPRPVPSGRPAEVALPSEVAEAWEVSVGDTIPVTDDVFDEERPVVVAGVWEPREPTDPYWQLLGGVTAELDRWGPLVVHPDEFGARYQRLATLEWLAVPDPAALARAGLARAASGVEELRAELARGRGTGSGGLAETARIRTDLDELVDRLETATVVNRSGLMFPAALLAVIAGYTLVLLAQLVSVHRQSENALLRARGASRIQLARYPAVEAALVVGPAAVAGAPVGGWLVRVADGRAGDRGLGLAADLAPYGWAGPPVAWALAVSAAAGCALALVMAAARPGRTWVAERQARLRPVRATLLRAGVDVALVGLAVLAWLQLRQYGQAVTPRGIGALGIDPLLVAAPVVAVSAATAVTLRLLPMITRRAVPVAGRSGRFSVLLGLWQADRRPHAGPVLLLMLAVGAAVLAPTVAATWQQSQRDQAAQAVGADLRLSGTDPGLDPLVREHVGGLPRVDSLMVANRTATRLSDGTRVPVLSVVSDRLAEVALLRDDLVPAGGMGSFSVLGDDLPRLDGIGLPDGTRRLVGTVRFDGPAVMIQTSYVEASEDASVLPLAVPGPRSGPAALYLTDGNGVIRAVHLGPLPAGQVLRFDVMVPAAYTTLVGVGAGLQMDAEFTPGDAEPPVAELSWHWRDLAAVDGAGNRTRLAPPASWQVWPEPDHSSRNPPELRRADETGILVRAGVEWSRFQETSLPFLVTEPVEVPNVPALFTPAALAGAGGGVGDVIDISRGVTVRVAGTVPALPGVADLDGVVVDLGWLSLQRYLSLQTVPRANEWWLATSDPAPAVTSAQRLGLEVRDRRAEAGQMLADPLGGGVLLTLWSAAALAALLAAFGSAVDARATAVGRRAELAVLHTLGASPGVLTRALIVEQAVLAGLAVVAGAAVGLGVAAVMGASLVLTPAGAVPLPEPLVTVATGQLVAYPAGLFLLAILLGAVVARRARRELAAGALKIGAD